MAKLTHIQTSFTAGEITPRMKGRPDVARYANGAEIIENGIVSVHGGVDRRHGMRFLARAKHGGERRVDLVRYRFNVDQAYMLEFGHLYVRIYAANGAQLLDESLDPIEVASPYTEDQVFEVTKCQGGDTLFLFHPDVPTHRLRRSGTSWSMEPVPWVAEPFAETGERPDARLSVSDPTVGTGRTFSTSATAPPDPPTIGTATPFNASARVSFTPPADSGGGRITGYRVTSSPGGITAEGPTSPILVPGLTNGVAYTFTVQAINGAGLSSPSGATAPVTPLGSLPSGSFAITLTPANIYAEVGNGPTVLSGPTATAPGAIAPVTWQWNKIAGGPLINLTGTNAQAPTIQSEAYNASNYMTIRVRATDASGSTGEAFANVSVAHKTGGPGQIPD